MGFWMGSPVYAEEKKKKKKKKNKKKQESAVEMEGEQNAAKEKSTIENWVGDGAEVATVLHFILASQASREAREHADMVNFANYLQRVFCAVRSTRSTQWMKMFNELAQDTTRKIPEEVREFIVSWIQQQSDETLGRMVLGALNCIVADFPSQRTGSGGSMSQVVMFLLVSLILRQKPDVLISLLPSLRENSSYHGEKQFPMFVWMIMQACQGDLTVGLYLWAREILPILGIKSNPSPETKDLVLQVVESILSAPNAEQILVDGFERNGERLIPPAGLELLLHQAFPSAPVEETDRFEAVYPVLRAIAVVNVRGSDSMKQHVIHIQDLALRAIEEGNAKLSDRATRLFVFCLASNPECYKRWDSIYEDNVEKSIAILRTLEKLWVVLDSCDDLRETLNSFRHKNGKAMSGGKALDVARHAVFREADEHCKGLLRTLSLRWRRRLLHALKLSALYSSSIAFIVCLKVFNLDEIAWKL